MTLRRPPSCHRRVPPLRGLFVLLALTLTASTAPAQSSQTFGDVRITGESVRIEEPKFGYLDHAFTIENRSTTESHRVTLSAPASDYGGTHRITRLRRSIVVPPDSRALLSIPQPPVPLAGQQFRVSIDGRSQRDNINSGVGNTGAFGARWATTSSGREVVYVLASADAMDVPSVAEDALAHEFQFTRHTLPVNRWSRRWLNYSAYAAIAFTADEWRDAPPGLRSTLLDYTRAGGVLCLLGDIDLPTDQPVEPFAGGEAADLGFGRVLRLNASQLAYDLNEATWRELTVAARDTHRVLAERESVASANASFAVRDDIDVPIQSLFALLLVFAILAGPVNLIVLSRKRRRIWVLWTTPLISLFFCGSVVAYTLFADGITPTVRVGTVTWLDQEARRSATLGWLGYYAPLSPRESLRFDDRTELAPQFVNDYREQGRGRTLEWRGGEQHLVSGWVTPGVPSHFRVRRVDTDRRRLQITRDDDGDLQVANHLQAPIRTVHYMAADGSIHRAENIPTGDRAVAEPADDAVPAVDRRDSPDLRRLFRSEWRIEPPSEIDPDARLRRSLSPGGYVAILEQSPFVDPSLTRYHSRDQLSLVVGRLGSDDRPETAARSEDARP